MLQRGMVAVCFQTHTKHISTLYGKNVGFLCKFAKLRKASLCLPVCPSVRMEQIGSQWTDFREILYLRSLVKIGRKKSSLFTVITGMTNLGHIYDNTSPNSSYKEKGLRQKS